jgi:hypothetical protein
MSEKKKRLQLIREIKKNGLCVEFTSNSFVKPKDKSGVQQITSNSCLRPDIFLDNGRYCDGCPWEENCVCPIKKIYGKPIQKLGRKNRK